MKGKVLSFVFIYFSGSVLFNGLLGIKIKNLAASGLAFSGCVRKPLTHFRSRVSFIFRRDPSRGRAAIFSNLDKIAYFFCLSKAFESKKSRLYRSLLPSAVKVVLAVKSDRDLRAESLKRRLSTGGRAHRWAKRSPVWRTCSFSTNVLTIPSWRPRCRSSAGASAT